MDIKEAEATYKRNMDATWQLFTNYGLSVEDKAELFMMMLEEQRRMDELIDEDTHE